MSNPLHQIHQLNPLNHHPNNQPNIALSSLKQINIIPLPNHPKTHLFTNSLPNSNQLFYHSRPFHSEYQLSQTMLKSLNSNKATNRDVLVGSRGNVKIPDERMIEGIEGVERVECIEISDEEQDKNSNLHNKNMYQEYKLKINQKQQIKKNSSFNSYNYYHNKINKNNQTTQPISTHIKNPNHPTINKDNPSPSQQQHNNISHLLPSNFLPTQYQQVDYKSYSNIFPNFNNCLHNGRNYPLPHQYIPPTHAQFMFENMLNRYHNNNNFAYLSAYGSQFIYPPPGQVFPPGNFSLKKLDINESRQQKIKQIEKRININNNINMNDSIKLDEKIRVNNNNSNSNVNVNVNANVNSNVNDKIKTKNDPTHQPIELLSSSDEDRKRHSSYHNQQRKKHTSKTKQIIKPKIFKQQKQQYIRERISDLQVMKILDLQKMKDLRKRQQKYSQFLEDYHNHNHSLTQNANSHLITNNVMIMINNNTMMNAEQINQSNDKSVKQIDGGEDRVSKKGKIIDDGFVKKQAKKAFLKNKNREQSNKINDKFDKIDNKNYNNDTESQKNQFKMVQCDKLSENIHINDIANKTTSNSATISNSFTYIEWTSRLKRLRQLTKKRDNDPKILIGPEFQAQIPKMRDFRQEKYNKIVKRNNLLTRLYNRCDLFVYKNESNKLFQVNDCE